jgi:hypothetical protein
MFRLLSILEGSDFAEAVTTSRLHVKGGKNFGSNSMQGGKQLSRKNWQNNKV